MLVNALDPNLASLAANAAVEIDLHLNNQPTKFEAVLTLKDCLNSLLERPTAKEPAMSLLADTETQTLLGQAFIEVGEHQASILGELMKKTDDLVQSLGGEKTEQRELEWLRSFCLALSKKATSFQQLIFHDENEDPTRR